MAFRLDSWMISYEACETLGREIMEQISNRNQQQKNSVASCKASAQARKLIRQYDEYVVSLRQALAFRSLLTEEEFERRQRLLDGLYSKKVHIDQAFTDREEGGTRQALLGADLGGFQSNVWDIEETEATKDLTFDEIRQQQTMAIQEQDKGLNILYDAVVRQKQMAQNIGQELNVQNEIIDDIVDHASNTRERLIKETRHVEIVDRKSGTCGYWVVILLLFISIIVVAVVPV